MSHIEALSLQAYNWGMSTNFLNPSPYKLRKVEDKGSLLASTQNIKLFSREKVEDSAWLKYGKPVRAVARALYTIGVLILVAPVGLAYHGGSVIARSFMMLQGHDAANHNWQKIKQHTAAFSDDLILGLNGVLHTLCIAAGAAFSPLLVVPGVLMHSPIIKGIWPRFIMKDWPMPEHKAHIFRDEFGLVNENGGLLTVDMDKDQEDLQLNGQLGQLWKKRCKTLLDTAQAIQRDAAQQPDIWPPNGNVIAHNIPEDLNLTVGSHNVSAKSYLKCLQKEIDVARDALTECLKVRHKGSKHSKEYYITVPTFPFNRPAAE